MPELVLCDNLDSEFGGLCCLGAGFAAHHHVGHPPADVLGGFSPESDNTGLSVRPCETFQLSGEDKCETAQREFSGRFIRRGLEGNAGGTQLLDDFPVQLLSEERYDALRYLGADGGDCCKLLG